MNDGKPSTPLLVLLAGCVALAGWMYGLPLITGSETDVEDEFIVPTDLGFVDDEPETEIDPWVPPESPRDPFLPVELGTLDGSADGTLDGDIDDGAEDDVDPAIDPAAADDPDGT